jgi:hypothetical protein
MRLHSDRSWRISHGRHHLLRRRGKELLSEHELEPAGERHSHLALIGRWGKRSMRRSISPRFGVYRAEHEGVTVSAADHAHSPVAELTDDDDVGILRGAKP